ncbi:MAG: hypothetical protein DCE90_12125 [Pseudanabaena sp.]|nr:MAG: hypothetical protein DCE90_12125 [Pseudanabaena sp.]
MTRNLSKLISAAAIATSLSVVPIAASAATFDFANIPATSAGEQSGDDLAPSLKFDVNESGSGTKFDFKFLTNSSPSTAAFISRVFIDGSTTLLGANNTITVNSGNSGTVVFSGGLGNDNLAQGNKLNPAFTSDYVFSWQNGNGNVRGIQEGESLGVLFASANFADVIAAINDGSLRVGYRIQSIGANAQGSDSFVSIPNPPRPVPVPGFVLGILAAGALGGKRLLSKKQSV